MVERWARGGGRAALVLGLLVGLWACDDEKDAPEAPPATAVAGADAAPATPAQPIVSAKGIDRVIVDAPAPGQAAPAPEPPPIKAAGSTDALQVVAAIPVGRTGGEPRPTITFSRPVRALGDRSPVTADVAINPMVEGEWKWLGSTTLQFTPKAPMPLSTAFEVRVRAGLQALDGGALPSDYSFAFETPRLRPQHGQPVNAWNEPRWVRPDDTFEVTFDQMPREADFARGVTFRGPRGDVPAQWVSAKRLADEKDADAHDRRVKVTFKPGRALEVGAGYELHFGTGLGSAEGPLAPDKAITWSFRTHGALSVDGVACKSWYGACPTGPMTLSFSNPVTAKALKAALTVEPAVELFWPDEADDAEPAKSAEWTLWGRFQPASGYTVRVQGVKDIFGQLQQQDFEGTFRTGDREPTLRVTEGHATIERSQRAALPVAHVNMDTVQAGLVALDPHAALPWLISPYNAKAPPGLTFEPLALPAPRNERGRTPLDLTRALGGEGKSGIVYARLQYQDTHGKHETTTLVQVTGMGTFLKMSPTNGALWVWRLKDGTPVADASVELLDKAGNVKATARTGPDGVAKLPGVASLGFPADDTRWGPPFLAARVVAGDDQAMALLDDTWNLGPYRFSLDSAWEAEPPTSAGTAFVDRGIYRPGEKVYLKGILRERSLGQLRTPADRPVKITLFDPRGETVAKVDARTSAFGGVTADFEVPKDGRLGGWSVSIEDASTDLSWGANFRVAEYRAPNFLVEVQPPSGGRFDGDAIEATVEGRYLFGAAMSGAEVAWSVTSSPGSFEPEDAQGYVFGRSVPWWEIGDGGSGSYVGGGNWTLDAEGRFALKAGNADAPEDRPLVHTIEASVTDVDRQVVAGRASFPVHPAAFYVGLRTPAGFATSGEAFEVSAVARDAVSQARVGADGVTVKLVRHSYNRVKKKNATGGFETVTEKEEVEVGRCTVAPTTTAPATCTLTPQEAGEHEVVAEAKDAKGRATVTRAPLWVLGPGYAAWLQDDDNRVEVVADKGRYDVGDTATLLVQSPFPEAEAWVTVEREGVLWQKRMKLEGTATPIEVPIDASMIPNVFVGVVLQRGRVEAPGKPGDPGRPAFRVGYVKIPVRDSAKRLAVTVAPDAPEKRPGDRLGIDVAVADHTGQGQEAEVTIWAVDEGVLALTGFTTPDPLASLHPQRGLSVRQQTNLAHLVAQLDFGDKGRDTGGGGGEDEGAGESMNVRRKFVTTPIFVGSAVTGKDGKVRVDGKLPDNLTTFRLMAVAVTKGDLAGSGQGKVIVSKPLLARPALPRITRAGDTFAAGVVVHTRGDAPVEVEVTAIIDGPIEGLEGLTRTLTIPPNRGVEVRFPFAAKSPGEAKMQFTVKGGGMGDAVETVLPVLPPTDLETMAVYGLTEKEVTEALTLPGKLRPDAGGLTVSLASSALAGLSDSAEALIDYPYGCLEQRSSRLVPLVALKGLLDANGERWLGKRSVEDVVAENVKALAALQRPSGGFSYWPGGRYAHYWASAYTVLALGEAERAGYDVSPVDLGRARAWLRDAWDKPQGWWGRPPSPETQALGLFVLARHGAPEPELERRLYARADSLALFGKALLAASMARPGPTMAQAQALVKTLANSARIEADTVHFAEDDPATYAPVFHSDTRTTAIALMAFVNTSPDHPFVPKIVRHLLEVRRGGGYRNTQEAGFSLLAMADFQRIKEAAEPAFTAKVELGGKALVQQKFEGRSLDTQIHEVAMSALGADLSKTPMVFSKDGAGTLYYGARLQFAPAEVPTEPRDDGLVVQRWYAPDGKEARLESVTEGDLIRVHLRIATPQERHYVVVADPLPAGLEAVDTTLQTSARVRSDGGRNDSDDASTDWSGDHQRWYSPFGHTELRDDRVLLFADHLPPGVHTYSYVARATTAGTFVRAPARAEEMYTPEVSGRSDGGKFWVHPRAELSQR